MRDDHKQTTEVDVDLDKSFEEQKEQVDKMEREVEKERQEDGAAPGNERG